VTAKRTVSGIALLTAFHTRDHVCLPMVVTEIQSGSRALHGFKITPIVVHGRGAGNGIPCLNVPIVVQLRCPPCQHVKLSLSICRGVSIDDVELLQQEDAHRDVTPTLPLALERLQHIESPGPIRFAAKLYHMMMIAFCIVILKTTLLARCRLVGVERHVLSAHVQNVQPS